ncbi:MAG: hypothetical protein MI807_05255, partial [Verrucomicrobiales bacterium]|nr:hypothetical protein [Verrucomicrobiales bacterium]
MADQVGTGRFGFAQIGHGGRGRVLSGSPVPNEYSGDIIVDGGSGSVDLIAGQNSTSNAFRQAHIGHGGSHDSLGNFSGNIRVTGTHVNLDAGPSSTNYARVGHGGWVSGVNTGTRTGDIYVAATGEVSIEDPAGGGVAAIGHHNEDAAGTIFDANVTIKANSMDDVFGASGGNVFQVSNFIGNMLQDDLAAGDVSLHATGAGGILFDATGDVEFTSANDFNILSESGIQFESDVQNGGAGNINVVAGWNSAVAGLADPLTGIIADVNFSTGILGVAGSFANSGGAVALNATSRSAEVGSRAGQTNVAANRVSVNGSDTSVNSGAQIGFSTTTGSDSTGEIAVHTTTGGVLLSGGDAEGGFARIGHGGENRDGNADAAITVQSVGSITLASGAGVDSAAQIGHGGYASDGFLQGELSVVSSDGEIRMAATEGGIRSFVQIGHGGVSSGGGDKGGEDGMGNLDQITVSAADDIVLLGGGSDAAAYQQHQAYAMIGNGGYEADADTADDTGHRADITVHAGTDGTGSVILRGTGTPNNGDDAFVLIGNGGGRAGGDHSGDISVTAADDVLIHLGKDYRAFSQIGHGGYDADDFGTGVGHSGTIDVTATNGTVQLSGTPFVSSPYFISGNAYSQIGHGGISADGNHTGDISVLAGDRVLLNGGSGDNNSKQIGHGGHYAKGDFSGSVSVRATNNIELRGGTNDRTTAQIGHGGYEADGNHQADFIDVISDQGAIVVNAGKVNGFDNNLGNAVGIYAQIGLGGVFASGNMSAPVTVSANGNITMNAGGNYYAYSQIGNGGWEAFGDKSGVVSVTSNTGEISMAAAGRAHDTYAQIGHGGTRVDGTLQDDVTVSAANGVEILGGRREAVGSYAQVGHGGLEAVGNKSGVITLNSDNDGNGSGNLTVTGGSAEKAYALVGHGGIAADGFIDGLINVNVGGNLDVSGGSGAASGNEGNFNFGQIGHSLAGAVGGFGGFTERDGKIVVEGEMFTGSNSGDWFVVTPDTPIVDLVGPDGFYQNARGGSYAFQRQGGGTGGPNGGDEITFSFTTDGVGGEYRFYPRWTGYDGGSDSIFFNIEEVSDGAGGEPDWVEYAGNADRNFATPGWYTTGGVEINNASATPQSAVLWNLAPNTTYTMRVSVREDGVGVDAFVLQKSGMADPVGAGPGVTFTNASGVSGASDINVTAGGNINLTGGANSDAYAAIGHGGSHFGGVNSNLQYGSAGDGVDISVTSTGGNILLDGNSSAPDLAGASRRYASIGHHGVDAGFDAYGDVEVHAEAGTVSLRGGEAQDSFAAIGHSGGGVFLDPSSVRRGEICVVGVNGIDLGVSGNGPGSYVQIGHGGIGVAGDLGGDITAVAPSGAVAGAAGSGAGQYAQIGHGGVDADGVLSGNVNVVAGAGSMALTGGGSADAYAMIGHGDGAGTSEGTRQGGIHLFSSGQITAVDGSSEAHLFHQTEGDLQTGDYTGGDGLQVVANGGLAVSDASLRGVNQMIAGNWNQGPISLAFSNDIDLEVRGNSFDVATSEDFYLMTGGSIVMEAGYQNSLDGDVFLVAGWNGSGATFNGTVTYSGGDFCLPEIAVGQATFDFNTCANFGNNNGDVLIGNANQASGVAVGSRQGINGAGAYGLTLQASNSTEDSHTQFGFRTNGSGQATGAVDVNLKEGGLFLNAGDAGDGTTTGGSYVQIGHGGLGADADGTDAAISISFCEPGEVRADGGNGFNAYAMIGSGGNSLNQDNAGTITLSNALQVDLNAGRGNRSGAQVGHGGYDADGSHNGDIEIGAANFIDVTAGFGQRSAGQIGHGGFGDNVGANTGDISLSTIAAGAGNGIHLVAGSSTVGANTASYAHIGHGGYASAANQSGDISLDSAGNITLTGGNRDLNYKQIGHGGRNSTAAAYGAINLSADGNIDLIGGTNDYDYAQVGHGGANSSINKSAAAVGTSGAPDGINVSSGGAIRVLGGDQNGDAHDGRFAYAQIGMGGANSGGPFNGDVTVSAQNGVEISGGGRDHNYARIGHGGDKETLSPNTKIGNITVTTATGDIALKGGTNHELTSATIGHGGFRVRGNSSGMIEVHALAGKVTLLSGGGDDVGGQNTFGDHSYSSAQIGHGGSEITLVDGSETLSGEICVVGLAGVELHSDGDGDRAFTQIGHGGYNAHGDFDGEINVVAPSGSVLLNGGDAGAEGQYAQIGHGGISSEGTFSSDITVVAGDGDTVLAGGDADNSYAMIGNGDGAKTSLGDREGGIHLFSSGQLSGTNGVGTGSEVWIFHQNNNGLQPGEYLGGDGYQKIANGGITLPAGVLADETTIINGNLGTGLIQILDSNNNNDYVIDASNIGISEIDSANDFFIIAGGNITMLTSFQNSGSGDVTLVAGWNGAGTSVGGSVDYGNPVNFCDPAISDGGFTVDFNNCSTFGNNGKTITLGNAGQTDSIVVGSRGGTTTLAAHGVDVIAGNSDDAFTQVGFRPTATSGGTTGNIALHLKAGGLDLISATNASHSFAQIGHGGTGAHNSVLGGDITIDFCAPGDINLTANQGASGDGSYAQIGHGGNNWDDAKSGNITIDGASDITLMGGRQNGYAQIGHGGSKDSSGSYGSGAASGNISVLNTAGKVSLLGGDGSENGYVQIGNGGIAMNGATSGNVTVHAGTGGIEMRGGDGNRSSALIGNGGYNNNQPVSGDVSVVTTGTGLSDGILMQGGTGTSTGVGIGNGNYLNGTTIGGDTTIDVASGGLTLRGGSGQYSYGYIGHGSRDDASTMSGDVTLTIGSGDLLVAAGTHPTASAIIGHGGFGESGSKLGDITINVAGDITVGDVNSLAFSQIGHGGQGSAGSFEGDIAVSSIGGNIDLIGGNSDGIYAQVGHGGAGANGSAEGDIFLNVDPHTHAPGSGVDVSLIAGAGTGSYAQVGHGGVGATGNKTGNIAIDSSGDLKVTAGAEDLA